MTFSSPSEAYHYVVGNSYEVEGIIKGKVSAWVIGKKDEFYRCVMVPKTSRGWKLGLSNDDRNVGSYFANRILVNIYQYKDTNDYYVRIADHSGKERQVSDAYGSEYLTLKSSSYDHYAYLSDYQQDYSFSIAPASNQIQVKHQELDYLPIIMKLFWNYTGFFYIWFNVYALWKSKTCWEDYCDGQNDDLEKRVEKNIKRLGFALFIAPTIKESLYWIKADFAYQKGDIDGFLKWLEKIKLKNSLPNKRLVLCLYYLSVDDNHKALDY